MNMLLFKADMYGEGIKLGFFEISAETIEKIVREGLKVIIILFLMFISIKIGNKIIDKFIQKQVESENKRFSMSTQKAMTIGGLLKSLLKYVVYFIGIAGILADFFKGISLTAASIGGFAIGFGAQSLVKDLINGFFILFEDQYGVGDYVTIGTFSGIIDSIGIRTTAIKDFNGDMHLIPNGTIQAVTNHSKSDKQFIVDVSVSYNTDLDYALDTLKSAAARFEDENPEVTRPLEVWGVTALASSGVTIRTVGYCTQMNQWSIERGLRKVLKEALDNAGIEIPFNTTEIIVKSEEKIKQEA